MKADDLPVRKYERALACIEPFQPSIEICYVCRALKLADGANDFAFRRARKLRAVIACEQARCSACDQTPARLRDCVNSFAAKLIDLTPRGFFANEKPAIRAAPQSPVSGLKKRANEIALRLHGDDFRAQASRIVATRAAISAEPDDAFAVYESRIDVIRSQSPGGAVEGETLDHSLAAKMKCSVFICPDPHFVLLVESD